MTKPSYDPANGRERWWAGGFSKETIEKTLATPAIADNTIHIRTDRHLYAIGKRK